MIFKSPKLINKSIGKPYSQQPGRKPGKGAGHIVIHTFPERLFHYTPNKEKLLKTGFTKEGMNDKKPQISLIPQSELRGYQVDTGHWWEEREKVEVITNAKILDVSDDPCSPMQLLNGYGDNEEFNEILKEAANHVGVKKQPYLSNDIVQKQDNNFSKFWTKVNEGLIKRGYGGYRAGAEVTIVDPYTLKIKE